LVPDIGSADSRRATAMAENAKALILLQRSTQAAILC